MVKSNKIKIIFPSGEMIQCDKLIASVQNNDVREELEQLFIGDWSLEELAETKFILDQIFMEQIKEQLPPAEKMLLKEIQVKQEKQMEEFENNLSAKEKELYRRINYQTELVKMEDITEMEEVNIEDLFSDFLESDSEFNSPPQNTNSNKVINLEAYRNTIR
ncbi:hypothetical protein Halha_1636 [Halobacteroides halobius DSM 5150]|uniref:Uncharacterized protein n=1 Tax=Halobacteroides halobius (strain ATCC 35273 / DSM 5150 / MD-1) TaxID=748449 RepID=L0KB23_HALHC|nr:hypothetical protein [Halobacteroides halobius]AGB41574.1 hypothetical protein Halha_1636 [Halobacteroides halobius DSM 5150]